MRNLLAVYLLILTCVGISGCDRTAAPIASRLTKANVDQIHQGMTQNQVEQILGAPTNSEKKDFVIYKRTTFQYVEGKVFVKIAFKNDELDTKETNIGTQ